MVCVVFLSLTWLPALSSAQADDPLGRVAAQIPPAWRRCAAPEECSVIAFSCSGRVAVNRSYKGQAEEIIYRSESASWAACNVPVSAGITPVCHAKVCKVKSGPYEIHE
jgi:hypothetical protein